jgi:enterobacterial common antigen flippase
MSSPPDNPPQHPNSAEGSSYGTILKSSAMIGGSTALNLLVSMARAKAGAIFLGPEGVGLVGLFYKLLSMLTVISGLGINSSGVRQVAVAVGSGDTVKIARTVRVMRRICWVTGLGGWLVAAIFAWPLSQWIFGNHERTLDIALIGSVLLFGAISGGQMALVQGMRRISDLAKFNVMSSVLATATAILCYSLLGRSGIVLAIVLGGLLTLANSWWFARRITIPKAHEISFVETLIEAKALIGLGVAFMWSGLLQTSAILIKSAMVVRLLGLTANGYYNAAWSMSGMFSTMILGSMAADYYPRLTSVADNHIEMRRMVNEQTEIGILVCLPFLMGIIIYASLAITFFYSSEFLEAARLLQWFSLGVFCRVIAWPMGYIMLAKGRSDLFALTETFSNLFHLALSIFLLFRLGLVGIPIAFLVSYIVYNIAMLLLSNILIGYRWSLSVISLMLVSVLCILCGFLSGLVLPGAYFYIVGTIVTVFAILYSLRGLAFRLTINHRLVRLASEIPLLRWVFPNGGCKR